MAESTMEIQDYLVSYVPSLIEGFLTESPVADMEGTSFTVQVTIEGEKSLTFGITINNGREIAVHPGGLENPMVSVSLPEGLLKQITKQVSTLTGKKQYDEVSKAKGSLTVEMSMPGDWVLPVTMTFNGASEPQAKIIGPSDVIAKMVAGEMSSPEAFMQGKIKMDGDMMFLMSLANILM